MTIDVLKAPAAKPHTGAPRRARPAAHLVLGLVVLSTLMLLAVPPEYPPQPPPFPNRFYMVTPQFYLLLLPWLGLLLVSFFSPTTTAGKNGVLFVIYTAIIAVVEIYWILHIPIATHWDEINHLGTSLLLQKRGSLPREFIPGHEYLDFPLFFLLQALLLDLGVAPLATAHVVTALTTLLAYLLVFLIFRRLFAPSSHHAFVASLLFLFTNLILSGSNHGSPFLLANVFFYAFVLVYVARIGPVVHAFLVILMLGAIALTNITITWPLAMIVLAGAVSTRTLRLAFLPVFALSWMFYSTVWFQVYFFDIANRNLELLRQGEFVLTLALLYPLQKVEVPLWATVARLLWVPVVFLAALWFVAKRYFNRPGLKRLFDTSFVYSQEGLFLALFFVPPLASGLAIPLTYQGQLLERALAFSSLPAAYFATRYLQLLRTNFSVLACLLVLWAGLFFFVREPFLYYRTIHAWDDSAMQFISQREIPIKAPLNALVTKKLYDESYGRAIPQDKKLTIPELAELYPDRFLYVPESADVFAYWLTFKWAELSEENAGLLSVMYNNGHSVTAHGAAGRGAPR